MIGSGRNALTLKAAMLISTAIVPCVVTSPVNAQVAGVKQIDVPAQALSKTLTQIARQTGVEVVFSPLDVRGRNSSAIRGSMTVHQALTGALRGTGFRLRVTPQGAFAVELDQSAPRATAPASAETGYDEIIVTAQKKEEKIIDVPIALTALSAEAMDDMKIEGGAELLRAVPNVNFSKSNFSMYNFSIRGIGTKAVSASSDPAVAVSFNNTPLVRNRLFEAEFFDMQRVEVLRGPQGTLYGRNATAGVVNLIPALPGPTFGGELKGEAGNYSTKRLSGMLNLPLGDTLGVRVAGAKTKRDGFDYNTFTGRRVNGRDLWSTRTTLAWEPSDSFRANVIWQHFEEDDNRSRTGKQLCTTDPGPEQVGGVIVSAASTRGKLSQGCLPGSLYDAAAYGTPNGNSLVYILVPAGITLGFQPGSRPFIPGPSIPALNSSNPYEGVIQSQNLREISTSYDPIFRAKNDVVQVNLEFNPSESLKIVSQTAYARDRFYSSQDYNRVVSNPIFNDSAQAMVDSLNRPRDTVANPGPTPNGIFCDYQLGCSDRMISVDLSRSRNRQWSQELRLQSDFEGPLNFNLGGNFIDFKSQDDYYVFNNMFTYIAEFFYRRIPNTNNVRPCDLGFEGYECPYVDQNPIDSLDNQGHNYFLSQNGVRIKSYAGFGEAYWKVTDKIKLTLGLRYTRDKKISTQIPSQLLLAGGTDTDIPGNTTGGQVNSGYPALPDIHQEWGRFTGRAVVDWKPETSFSDETLVYLSAARGYKGGGTNPPRVDFNPAVVQYQFLPETFRPEYVNAFEIGTKNSFNGGRFTFNANAFFYDYKDYQISQIVDRIAYNENFGATSWGLEFEGAWRPSRAFRLDGNLGFLKTRLKRGSESIDVMNRTQGDPEWMVIRPWLQVPSNCIAPRAFVERILAGNAAQRDVALAGLCPGSTRTGDFNPNVAGGTAFHTIYGFTYDPLAPYNPDTVGLNMDQGGSGAPNGGRGFSPDLVGNELPNAPRWTANVGAQYTFILGGGDWEMTFRGDYYRQSKSFARIYNTTYDRLKSWDNVNLAMTLSMPDNDFSMQLYVKNLFDKSPITDFFTNSDDTALTTNVFTLDPRIIGFIVGKKF